MLVGLDGVKGAHGVETVLLAALYDALLAPFVFFLVRKVLGTPDRVRGALVQLAFAVGRFGVRTS